MATVHTKEQSAETIAHVLDDMLRIPGTRMRLGADPLLGLLPVIGDVLAVLMGTSILIIARQVQVPWRIVASMGFNQLKNGLIGSIPFLGDAYSFHFKSNAVNVALLLRAVKHGDGGACELTARSIAVQDIAIIVALTLPVLALIGYVSLWFWDHNISYMSLFFPIPYRSR